MTGLFDSRAVITGAGQSSLGRMLDRPGLALTAESCLAAIADAGLEPKDIDGVATYPGAGADVQRGMAGDSGAGDVINVLGLRVNWYCGTYETTSQLGPIINACMAVASGVANHVVCFRTVTEGTAQKGRGRRTVIPAQPKPGQWSEWGLPFGQRSPSLIGLYAQRYMAQYGLTREQLAQVAINDRRNAARNPHAVFREPLSLSEYLGSRMITSPLCLYDCDIPMDGSTAIIVSRAGLIKSPPRSPLKVESVGCATRGRYSFYNLPPTRTSVHDSGAMLWENTRITSRDVDVAELYDGFSILTLVWLEALGFCGEGETGKFVEGGDRIALDGELPINTQGGQLSGGRLHGLGFLHEACIQLWGEGGERQLKKAPRVAVATAGGGRFSGCVLLSRND